MKIELEDKDVDRIAKAVAAKVGKPKAAKPAEAEAEESGEAAFEESGEEGGEEGGEASEFSKDDVLAKLKEVTKKHDQDTAMEVLKKVGGVGALSKLAEDKFGAVIAALQKKLK